MIVIISLFLGIFVGFFLRKTSIIKISNYVITPLLWLLLFSFGIKIGSNKELIKELPSLGIKSFFMALFVSLIIASISFIFEKLSRKFHEE